MGDQGQFSPAHHLNRQGLGPFFGFNWPNPATALVTTPRPVDLIVWHGNGRINIGAEGLRALQQVVQRLGLQP
jgi:hypothetical protein